DLCWHAALSLRDLAHHFHEGHVAVKVLALKAWMIAAHVIGTVLLRPLHLPGQETAAERTVRHKTDAQGPAGRNHLRLDATFPQRILTLQSADGMNRVRPAQRVRARLR